MRPLIVVAIAACATHAPPATKQVIRSEQPPLQPVAANRVATEGTWKPAGDVASSCRELFGEMEAVYATSHELDRLNIVDQLLADPPELPADQLRWCGVELRKFARAKPPELEREAIDLLDEAADWMVYQSNEKPEPGQKPQPPLCPPAAKVPSAIPTAGAPITPPETEWEKDKGWECLRRGLSWPLHFQYELRIDAAKQTFAMFARRIDDKGQLVELVLRGHVDAQRHVIANETIESPGGPIARHRRR